ncbi:hypothetical protein ABZX39_35615 [Streptomyces collinus]|uniref:hypothetical protein n=1 Tax=Streptomyces collinus TaxID=42684 RepID=UPI0033A9D8D4
MLDLSSPQVAAVALPVHTIAPNFAKIAAADPTGVIIDTNDNTPAQLADVITVDLTDSSPCLIFRAHP